MGAKELYQAHLTPYLQEAQSTLDSELELLQSQNVGVAERIQNQRKEIQSLLSGLEIIVEDLEGAANGSIQFSKENGLRQEAVQIDGELKAREEMERHST